MTGDLRPLRYPVRVTWFNRGQFLSYRVLIWCQHTFDGRFEVLQDAVATIIDFEREQDMMLFLLKWGKDGNEL